MTNFILAILCKKSGKKKPPLPQDVPLPPSVPLPGPIVNFQEQSPLYNKLAAELRVLIFSTVLGDPDWPLHIVPFEDRSGRITYVRCIDMASSLPTWQHKCFGRYRDGRSLATLRAPWPSDDKLLSILLSCRLIYSEAIQLLYTQNAFSFKGAKGVLALESIVPVSHWQFIQHVHISTIFTTSTLTEEKWVSWRTFPPEKLELWNDSVRALQGLSALRSILVGITFHDFLEFEDQDAVNHDCIVSILQSLRCIKAREKFEVELNIELPHYVRSALGTLDFTIVTRARAIDRHLHPL